MYVRYTSVFKLILIYSQKRTQISIKKFRSKKQEISSKLTLTPDFLHTTYYSTFFPKGKELLRNIKIKRLEITFSSRFLCTTLPPPQRFPPPNAYIALSLRREDYPHARGRRNILSAACREYRDIPRSEQIPYSDSTPPRDILRGTDFR